MTFEKLKKADKVFNTKNNLESLVEDLEDYKGFQAERTVFGEVDKDILFDLQEEVIKETIKYKESVEKLLSKEIDKLKKEFEQL